MRLLDRKPWQIIVAFALFGLAMAAAAYAYAAFYNYDKPTNAFDVVMQLGSVIVCPPQLLFVMCIDCEVIGWGGFIMYSIIGILNAALYAIIGYIVSYSRKSAQRS